MRVHSIMKPCTARTRSFYAITSKINILKLESSFAALMCSTKTLEPNSEHWSATNTITHQGHTTLERRDMMN
jgi:hypothetical protein